MNLAHLGEQNISKHGEYVSLVFEGREFTNVELSRISARFGSALAELGIQPGDRVGVMLPNLPEVPTSYGGITRVGGVIIPMLFLLAPPEIRHIVEDSEAKVVVTSPEFFGNVSTALQGMENPPTIIVTGDAPEGTLSLETLVAGAGGEHPIVERHDEDLAIIAYTSGTTGRPKGVMLSHGNLFASATNVSAAAATQDGDVGITGLPLAHLFGIGSSIVGNLFKIKGVLLRWFTAESFFEAMGAYRGTSSAFVPTMMTYLLSHPQFDEVDWSSLRFVVAAAAPVPVELAEEFEKRTGSRVLEGYGLTETSPGCSLMRLDDPRKPGSCGRTIPNVTVAILDDDDNPLQAREIGEICIRGANVFKGYYRMGDATAEAMRGGWFHSGDLGYQDEDGFLYVTERKKDLIIRGGLNIYPRDIEEVLYGHPAVQDAAVVGLPDATMGEEVIAYVVLRPGQSATEDELVQHCRNALAKYKSPKHLRLIDALPKNPIGKILKRDLRELAKEEFA
jgi:long-chain acyl-CoA synthetase